jgi:hypothetical protein
VGENVFLKVKVKRNSIRLGLFPKLAARYCGPFEILEKIAQVAYMLEFTTSMRVNNVFHVILLKKYVPDPNCIIDWTLIHVENEGDFRVELVCILDRKVKLLWNKDIGLIKFHYTYFGPEYGTWEHEETMRDDYQISFVNFEENRS